MIPQAAPPPASLIPKGASRSGESSDQACSTVTAWRPEDEPRVLEAILRDSRRLAALHNTKLLDTLPEESFDRLTRLAAHLLHVPVAVISLVDDRRQFFKSVLGIQETGSPLSHSFCKHVVARQEPLVIGDARCVPLVRENPAVSDSGVIAYLGIPLTTADGYTIGSFCAVDMKPHAWSEQNIVVLEDLARIAMSEVALRLAKRDIEGSLETARQSERFARSTVDALSAHVCILDESGLVLAVNRAWCEFAAAHPQLRATCGIGANYLSLLDTAKGDCWAATLSAGIRRMLGGETPEFSLEYVRQVGEDELWFLCRVTAFADAGPRRVVIAHMDITAQKRAEAAARQSDRKLIELSHTAGMAEVATSVLHNVGNVLNSVNVSCACMGETLQSSKASSLARVAALLREHEHDLGNYFSTHPQAQMLPDFLSQLAAQLAGERNSVLAELAHLEKSVGHIRDIVAMQQSHASSSGMVENLRVDELIEDAMQITSVNRENDDVEVVRQFDASLGMLMLNRHKILQILVNLIRNARHAMSEADATGKRLTVRTRRLEGGRMMEISLRDEGTGIVPDQLTRIFQHGFTTKKDGHGFGLHASALFARQMGGSLRVESAGSGCGATFILELPMNLQA